MNPGLLAGLGQGFSNIAPAIQLIMMLQEAKQEREARASEHQGDIASREKEGQASRALQMQIAQMEEADRRRREFTEPLARQGMFIDEPAYSGAATIKPPALESVISPDITQVVGRESTGLAQGANDAEQRLHMLRQKAAEALQTANRGGPGAVQSFEGGMAIGQAPFPNRSESTSTSFTGVVPDQLRLRELDIYSDALGRFVSNAVQNYRAVNPYGGNPDDEQRIQQDAISRFEMMWPSIRKQIMGTDQPISGAGSGTVRHGASVSGGAPGPVIPQAQPPTLPTNPTIPDARNRYRNTLRGRGRGY